MQLCVILYSISRLVPRQRFADVFLVNLISHSSLTLQKRLQIIFLSKAKYRIFPSEFCLSSRCRLARCFLPDDLIQEFPAMQVFFVADNYRYFCACFQLTCSGVAVCAVKCLPLLVLYCVGLWGRYSGGWALPLPCIRCHSEFASPNCPMYFL